MLNHVKNWKNEIITTLILAWPIILSNLSQTIIHATDVYFLGKLGADALAASAIGVGIVIAPLVFGIGLISASSPMIALDHGKKTHEVRQIRRTVRASMWAAVSISIPMMMILWFTGDFMLMANQPEKLSNDTGLFVRALLFQILPALLLLCLRNFVTALHRPIYALIISITSIFINAFLNYGLIFGHYGLPEMGLVGAGIGSSITNLLAFIGLALIVSFEKKFKRYHIFGRFWRADWAKFRAIWKLGFPISLQLGFEASVFSAAVFIMGYINTQSVAAHSIAIQIASMTFMVPLGIAQAATVRVGNALGRNDKIAIYKAGWSAFIISIGFMSLTASLMWLFPKQLAQIFINNNSAINQEVILIAIGFLKVAAIFQIADGAQVVGAGMLRGLHDTKWPMIYAGIGYWIFGIGIGAILAFVFGLKGLGIWIGLAFGLGIVAVLLIFRWINREKLGLC